GAVSGEDVAAQRDFRGGSNPHRGRRRPVTAPDEHAPRHDSVRLLAKRHRRAGHLEMAAMNGDIRGGRHVEAGPHRTLELEQLEDSSLTGDAHADVQWKLCRRRDPNALDAAD